jgi:hypothetical protein
MSAGFDADVFGFKGGGITNECAVVSIYEDIGGRDMLFQLCNSLARKFKGDLEFQFDWWRFKYLADPEIAMEAAQRAVQANLILLAPQSPELPIHVQGWFEEWLPNREAAHGALVLVQPSPKVASRSLPLRSYLRQTAKRARLDYLPVGSSEPATGGPGQETEFSLFQPDLVALLAHADHPLHWGINE